jgi:hypothetical protein
MYLKDGLFWIYEQGFDFKKLIQGDFRKMQWLVFNSTYTFSNEDWKNLITYSFAF